MTQGPTSICIPNKDCVFGPYDPIELPKYPYKKEVGSLAKAPWSLILKQRPEDLIPADPYAPSQFRPGGLGIWDSAIGVPGCTLRQRDVIHKSKTPMFAANNPHYLKEVKNMLGRAGLDDRGRPARIAGPFTVDLTRMENDEGWAIAEAMHVWAHWRSDYKFKSRNAALDESCTYGRIQQALGLYIVSKFFNLPMYVGEETPDMKAYPYFRQYGIDIKVTGSYTNPIILEPFYNNEAPRFDKTVATIVVAVRVEPEPACIGRGNMQEDRMDLWAGYPTVATIIGWERVDRLMHQPIVSYEPENTKAVRGYGEHPGDLNPPDTIPYLLALAKTARGEPIEDDRNMTFRNWMESAQYYSNLLLTPPRPCGACLGWQRLSEWALQRPPRHEFKNKTPAAQHYTLTRNKFVKMVRKAEIKQERKIRAAGQGRMTVKALRQLRTDNFKRKMSIVRDNNLTEEVVAKQKNTIGPRKPLTRRERKIYDAYQKKLRIEQERKCETSTSASTTVSPVASGSSAPTQPPSS